jgi:CheY-like chemotaxis protein
MVAWYVPRVRLHACMNMHPLSQLRGLRVLIVDDDEDSRYAVAEFLRMEGADVVSASSGNEGFGVFVMQRPAVIVSDLWMPDGDGYEFIRMIRGLPAELGGLTPAIAVSAAANRADAIRSGFEVFMAKPFDPSELVDNIKALAGASPIEPL